MHNKKIFISLFILAVVLLANPIKAIENNNGYLGIRMHKFPKARIAKEVTIIDVIPNSPAWNAGIRIADRILEVNDVDVSNYSVENIQKLVSGNVGEKVKLTLKTRNGVQDYTIVREVFKEKIAKYPQWQEICGDEHSDHEACFIHTDDVVKKLIEFGYGPFYVSTKGTKLAAERYSFENNLYLCNESKDAAMCYAQIMQNIQLQNNLNNINTNLQLIRY